MKKLIPAVALLLVSAVLLSTASFAWFSMNRAVTVTGMELKTKVSDNLFIASDVSNQDSILGESSFVNDITQARQAVLGPVSTVDGKNFYYASSLNARASGAVITPGVYLDYAATGLADDDDTDDYENNFSLNYGVTHDIAEAICMSDRVAVFTGRPACVRREFEIDLDGSALQRRRVLTVFPP